MLLTIGITFAFSCYELRKGKDIKVSEWLIEKGVDTVYSPKDFRGKGPDYVFSNAGVDVIVTKGKTLKDIRRDFSPSE